MTFRWVLTACAVAFTALSASGVAAAQPPLAETLGADIGYPDIETAIADLSSRPGIISRVDYGWRIFIDEEQMTLWSYTPDDHPAHPTLVRRRIEDRPAGSELIMTVHCLASKDACDAVVREFMALNERLP